MKRTKSGSLQLSIEAIVVLIIAITVLGLGLSFVKSLFGGTFEKLSGISEQLSEEDKKTIENSPSEITFLSSEIKASGKDVSLNFGVRNNRRDPVIFNISPGFQCFDAIGDIKDGNTPITDPVLRKAKIKSYVTFNTYVTKEVAAGKSAVIPLQLQILAEAPPTVYACKLNLNIIQEGTDATKGSAYSSKEFSIIKQ